MKSMKRMQVAIPTGLAIALGLASLMISQIGGANERDAVVVEKQAISEYVVQDGDTLVSIAMKLTGRESDWLLIAQANELTNVAKSQRLEAGMRLRIPEKLRQS